MTVRYNRVSPAYWPMARAWDDRTRVIGLYVQTCQHRHTEGLYALPKGYIEADLGYTAAAITRSLATLGHAGLIQYDDKAGVLLLPDALSVQAPTTENQIKGAIARLRMLPSTPLLWELYVHAQIHSNGFAQAIRDEFGFAWESEPGNHSHPQAQAHFSSSTASRD